MVQSGVTWKGYTIVARKETPADMFMNWADVSFVLDNADTSTLIEKEIKTGLSIRGQLIWLIHIIEMYWPLGPAMGAGPGAVLMAALSTRTGLGSFPLAGDDGVITKMEWGWKVATTGAGMALIPQVAHYLPPVPIAAPTISIYGKTNADSSPIRNKTIEARIGFTTAPLDAAAYTEIAEAWGW